jgi:N-acetylneuraminic acid mutarotase
VKDSASNALSSQWTTSSGFLTPKEWISKTELLTPLNVAPGSGVVGSKIYVIGGGIQYGTSNKVQIYDTENNSWSYGTSSSSANYHVYNNTAVVGTKIYMVNKAYYETSNNTWGSYSGDFNLSSASTIVAHGSNAVYGFGGGNSPNNYKDDAKKLNTSSDNITTLTSMPNRRGRGCAASDGTYIYLVGGVNDDGLVTTVDVYNPSNDTWQTKSSEMPIGTNSLGCAYYNNKIYIVGFPNDPRNLVYYTSSDSWAYLESLPGARIFPAVSIYDGKLYVMGGCCNYNDTNWQYDLN